MIKVIILWIFLGGACILTGCCWYLTRKIEKEIKEFREEIKDIKKEYKAIRTRVDKIEKFVREKEMEEGYKALRGVMKVTAEETFSAQREVVPNY